MIRKLIILMFVFVFAISCGNKQDKKSNEVKDTESTVKKVEKSEKKVEKQTEVKKEVVLSVDDFVSRAKDYVGEEVNITGTVIHVCKESGKKLFLGGNNPKNKVKITAGEKMPKFDVKLEGDTLQVKGIVKELRVDEAFLDLQVKQIKNKPETEKKEEIEKKEHHDAEPKEDHHKSNADSLKQIEGLRAKVKKSKEGYISFYSVEFISLKKIDDKTETKVEDKKEGSKK